MVAVTALGVNYMSSHAEYSLHYQSTPTQITGQRGPYNSFVALSVLLDYLVRRYIDHIETRNPQRQPGGNETDPGIGPAEPTAD